MKRTAKNERTNEQNAANDRRDRADVATKATRFTALSQALRRSTAALTLTCGVCVVVSGCQSFLGADDERFRRGRGEYALNDEAVLRDWEQAARETAGSAPNTSKASKTPIGKVGENGQGKRLGQNAENDPASSQPILRSAAFDEEGAEQGRRVALQKPVSETENGSPATFGERVKGLFSLPKKEPKVVERRDESAGLARIPNSTRAVEKSGARKLALPNVLPTPKRRGREKFPVDPVLQYDESRFMPSFQTCRQYHSPLAPRKPVEQPLTSVEQGEAAKVSRSPNLAQTAPTVPGSSATASGKIRQNPQTRVSGRELVANSDKRRALNEDAEGWATSGSASPTNSTTGWGKTRPIAAVANGESAPLKGTVAPVGYLNVSNKKRADFQSLTERCDGFFGWNAADEPLLNAIVAPTGEDSESLTAYSAPSPAVDPVAAPLSESSAFAAEVANVATENGYGAQLAEDAATLTTPAATGETFAAADALAASPSVQTTNESVAGVGEVAEKGGNAPVLTAYAPSPSTSTQESVARTRQNADFASQLGETNFAWFDSQPQNVAPQPQREPETTTVATIAPDVATIAPVETPDPTENKTLELIPGESRVDLDAALSERWAPSSPAVAEAGEVASSLPTAPLAAAEVGEVASSLPTAPVAVAEAGEVASSLPTAPVAAAEVGEVASSLPVAPISVAEVPEVLTPVVAEALEVEAPQALVAVETGDAAGKENGVAGPNFALAAPGLGAGEAIQDAADERKNAAVAKPLSGDEIAWVEQIKGAIRTLVAERDAKKAAGEDVRRLDARLRLLYLAVDEYDRSIQEIQDDADPLKVFWENERGDLETLLQSRLEEIDPTFVAERLRAGLDSLSGLCDLQIRKSALVVAPACFGLYEERAEAFKPGETVFAYAELEYVSCRETEDGRLIDVECRWRLLNADGSELTPVETQRCSNLSETKLRDVVLNVSAPLPNDLAPGTYLLETEVVDMNRPGAKPAKERLELTVVEAENAEKAAE